MLIINDISTIKNYYKELGDHKDHLLATVSHELRTPLNGILGMLDLSIEETKEQQTKERLEITQISAKLLLNMINDILDFSLISKGKLSLNIDKTDVTVLVAETIRILELQANMKGLKIVFEHSVRNRFVKTDHNRLRQVLLNLIGNAIKFTEKGVITVRIKESNEAIIDRDFSVMFEDSGGFDSNMYAAFGKVESDCELLNIYEGESLSVFHFEVEDTGIGIDRENFQSLFMLFGRLDNPHKNLNRNGVGLGLAISQSLVKRLSAKTGKTEEIKVQSQVGVGSRFFFRLGLLCRDPEDQSNDGLHYSSIKGIEPQSNCLSNTVKLIKRTPPEFTKGLSNPAKMESINVLAVDDDQINLIVITSYLIKSDHEKEIKYNLTTASNGANAIEIVNEKLKKGIFFDVVLMDCNMPIMDGYEASRILRDMIFKGIIPDIPIIAITANVGNSDKRLCLDNGMDYFLAKPLKRADLLNEIKNSLRSREGTLIRE
jgi:signal transduction histidine kinase/CheY-like chemotaxis protein